MFARHTALLLMLLSPALRAQEPALRAVRGDTLISPASPAASFAVGAPFRYLGGQTIDILGVAGAEQHFFIETAADHSIRRFYWIQFEHYYAGNHNTYNYAGMDLRPVQIGPIAFTGDVRTSEHYFTMDQRPGSDSKAAEIFLRARGLVLDGTFVTLRLFNLPDSTRRRELMIIYGEVLSRGASEQQVRAQITAHAQADLAVRLGAASARQP